MPQRSTPPSRPGQRSDALRDVLTELGDRVKPVVFARERTLPVAEAYEALLPDDGLVRGRVMSCQGAAAITLALGLLRDALVAGAWAAVVDVATFGADAASEHGVPLERIVRIDTGVDPHGSGGATGTELDWIDVMGAAVDGFDIVVTRVPSGLRGERRPAAVRKLTARLQQKGAVVVVLGDTGALVSDVTLDTERTLWSGLGDGDGHLRRRSIDVVAGGRRLPASRSATFLVDGTGSGRVTLELAPAARPATVGERDPQAELLAEMAGGVDPAGLDAGVVIADLAG